MGFNNRPIRCIYIWDRKLGFNNSLTYNNSFKRTRRARRLTQAVRWRYEMKIIYSAIIFFLVFPLVNSFAESKKDPLWEKEIKAKIEWQNDLAGLLTQAVPEAEEFILDARDIQITYIQIETEKYYYILQNHPSQITRNEEYYYRLHNYPSRIIREQGPFRRFNFFWSENYENKLLEISETYKRLKNIQESLFEKTKGHPMQPKYAEAFVNIRRTEQYQKIHKKTLRAFEEIDKELLEIDIEEIQLTGRHPQKTYFEKDEYGALYWQAETDWPYNWRFKTKTDFKFIEIVIIDQNENQDVLVDNETMNHSPFLFAFRLDEPKLMGSKTHPTLSIPYGYSRIGNKPMGVSNWATVEGNKVIAVSYNHNPHFDKSGEMSVATYKTSTGKQEFTSTIKITYEK